MFIRAFTELIQFINPGANNSCFCHVSFLPGQWVESVSLGAWRALDLLPARGTRQPGAGERSNEMRMGHRMFGALNDSCRWWRSAHYSFLCLPMSNSFRTSFIDQTLYRLQPAWKKNRSARSEWQRTYWKGTKFATFLILKPLLLLHLLQITYNSLVTPVPCQLFTQLLPICLPSYAQRPSLNTSTACSFYKPSKRLLPHMFMRNQLLINSQEAKSDTYMFVFTHEYVSNVYILKYVQVYLISLFPLFPHSLYARAPI